MPVPLRVVGAEPRFVSFVFPEGVSLASEAVGGDRWVGAGELADVAVEEHNRGGSSNRTCPDGMLSPSDIAAGGQHCICGLRHN